MSATDRDFEAAARGLATLHTAQASQEERPAIAYAQFQEAATIFEGFLAAVEMPAARLFLARAYVGAGRYQDALTVLEPAIDEPLREERAQIDREARGLILQRAVQAVIRGIPPVVAELAGYNRGLLDDQFAFDAQATALHYAARTDSEIADALDTVFHVMTEVTNDPLWDAIGREAVGVGLVMRRRPAEAIPELETALRIYRVSERKDFVALASNHLALAYSDAGRFAEAVEHFKAAIEHFRSNDRVAAARMMENLAASLGKLHRFSESLPVAREATQILADAGLGDQADKAALVVAQALNGLGRRVEALSLSEAIVDRGRVQWEGSPDWLASALTIRGYLLEEAGRLREAGECLAEARDLRETSTTAEGQSLSVEQTGMSSALNEWDSAIQEEIRLLDKYDAAGMTFDAARTRLNLAKLFIDRLTTTVYSQDERSAELTDGLRQATALLDEAEKVFVQSDSWFLAIEVKRTRAKLMSVLDKERAAAELRAIRAEAAEREAFGLAASIGQNLATLLVSLGRVAEARDVLEGALTQANGMNDASLSWHLEWTLARIERAVGNVQQAAKLFRRVVSSYEDQESAVDSPDLVLGWSDNKTFVFDEAVNFFLESNDAASAFEVTLAAKARTYRVALSKPPRRVPALAATGIAALLQT